jgi:hypothetical protein
MRRGELAAVTWRSLDLEGARLHMLPYSSRRTKLIERIIKRVYGRPRR